MIDPILGWAMRYGTFLVHKSYMNIVKTFLNLLYSYIKEYEDDDRKVPKEMDEILDNVSFFSLVWSIGGALEENSRKALNEVVFSLILVGIHFSLWSLFCNLFRFIFTREHLT
jgi:dynein heavy chain, axonemal